MNRISQNKVGAEEIKIEQKSMNQKTNTQQKTKAKSWLFGKISKINKYLEDW